MNSKVGNSLAIVFGCMCSAWRAILPGYLGSCIYRSLRGGVCPKGYQLSVWTRWLRSALLVYLCHFGQGGQAGYILSTLSTGSGEHCSVYLSTLASAGSAVLAWALTPSSPSKSSVPRSSHFFYHTPDILL